MCHMRYASSAIWTFFFQYIKERKWKCTITQNNCIFQVPQNAQCCKCTNETNKQLSIGGKHRWPIALAATISIVRLCRTSPCEWTQWSPSCKAIPFGQRSVSYHHLEQQRFLKSTRHIEQKVLHPFAQILCPAPQSSIACIASKTSVEHWERSQGCRVVE